MMTRRSLPYDDIDCEVITSIAVPPGHASEQWKRSIYIFGASHDFQTSINTCTITFMQNKNTNIDYSG